MYDRKTMGLDSGFQRVQLFQLLRSHLLESSGNSSFFDINFLSGEVFQLLHRFCERFQADGLSRGKERRTESRIIGERRSGRRILVIVKAVSLVRDFNFPGPEQGGKD